VGPGAAGTAGFTSLERLLVPGVLHWQYRLYRDYQCVTQVFAKGPEQGRRGPDVWLHITISWQACKLAVKAATPVVQCVLLLAVLLVQVQ